MQALAFLIEEDVVKGFELVKSKSPRVFRAFVDYFERYYIGRINPTNKERMIPRFPISYWNVHERVKNCQPRTNNNVESWHNLIQVDVKRNLNFIECIHLLRDQQERTDKILLEIVNGQDKPAKKSKKDIDLENRLLKQCKRYKSDEFDKFLEGVANNLRIENYKN
jgi:hypothetical protein